MTTLLPMALTVVCSICTDQNIYQYYMEWHLEQNANGLFAARNDTFRTVKNGRTLIVDKLMIDSGYDISVHGLRDCFLLYYCYYC